MSRFVLDASAAIAVVLGQRRGDPLLDPLETAASVVAPDIFVSEVANTLWKYVKAGELTGPAALAALDDALSLVDDLIPTGDAAGESLSEAIRAEHPVYDLCYVVAARRRAATLLTLDSKLARLAERLGVRVAL